MKKKARNGTAMITRNSSQVSKKSLRFYKEDNSQSLQEAVKQLDKAFKNFLKDLQIFQSHLQNYVVNVVTKTQSPSSLIGVGYVQSVKPMIEMLMQC